jgi:hypothetical protein
MSWVVLSLMACQSRGERLTGWVRPCRMSEYTTFIAAKDGNDMAVE